MMFKRQQFWKAELKDRGQFCQNRGRNIHFPPFDFSKILAADSSLFGQLLLRQTYFRS